MTKGEALSRVNKVTVECKDAPIAKKKFLHHPTAQAFNALDEKGKEEFCNDEKQFPDAVITEMLHALKLEVFGSDYVGKTSYNNLQNFIRGLKVNLSLGIRKWATRIDDLQSYLPLMLWEAGEKRGHKLKPFDEMELRTILAGALHKLQTAKLINIGWDLQEKEFTTSLATLEGLEFSIREEQKIQQRLANLEKGSPKSKGKSGGGKKNGKQSKKKKCPHCGKVHRGECWKLKNKGNKNKNKGYKRQTLDNEISK